MLITEPPSTKESMLLNKRNSNISNGRPNNYNNNVRNNNNRRPEPMASSKGGKQAKALPKDGIPHKRPIENRVRGGKEMRFSLTKGCQ